MQVEQFAALERIIKSLEETNANGKIILFFEDGEVKGVEIDKKEKLWITSPDEI